MPTRLLTQSDIDPTQKYTPHEAAYLIGFNPKTLEKWRFHNKGPNYLKIGGRVFYPGAELIAFETKCLQVTEEMADN